MGLNFFVFRLWGSGGTGRHATLRMLCRKACGFDSHLPYFKCPVAENIVPTITYVVVMAISGDLFGSISLIHVNTIYVGSIPLWGA